MNINVGSVYTYAKLVHKLVVEKKYEMNELKLDEGGVGECFLVFEKYKTEEVLSFILIGYNKSQGYHYKCIYKYPE